MNKWGIWIVVCVLLVPGVSSYSIDTYTISFDMHKRTVVAELNIRFNDSLSDKLDFGLPPSSKLNYVKINNQVINPNQLNNTISLDFLNAQNLTIVYETDFYIDKDDFIFDFITPFDIQKLVLTLKLPPKTYLEQGLNNKGGSIYPKPNQALTDGERLIFLWEKNNMNEGEELAVYAKIKSQNNWIAPLILIVAVLRDADSF